MSEKCYVCKEHFPAAVIENGRWECPICEHSNVSRAEDARLTKKIKARINAEHASNDWAWPSRRKALESELLKEKPHLADHKHCGLCPDSEDRPKHKVVFPNGHVIWSSWYKVPKTDADARRAFAENKWLLEQSRKLAD